MKVVVHSRKIVWVRPRPEHAIGTIPIGARRTGSIRRSRTHRGDCARSIAPPPFRQWS